MTDTNSHNEAEHIADPDGQFSSREADGPVHNLSPEENEATEAVEHGVENPAEHRAGDEESGSANPGPA